MNILKEQLQPEGKIVLSNIRPWFNPSKNFQAHIQMKYQQEKSKTQNSTFALVNTIGNVLYVLPEGIGVKLLNIVLTQRSDYTKLSDQDLVTLAKQADLELELKEDSYAKSTSIAVFRLKH